MRSQDSGDISQKIGAGSKIRVGNIFYFLLLPFNLLVTFLVLMSFTNTEGCLSLVKNYMQRMSMISEPAAGKVYYMNMKIKVDKGGAKPESKDISTEFFLTRNQLIYEAGQLSVYQDTVDAFMIVHPNKQIIWSKGGRNAQREFTKNKIAEIQKGLIDGSKMKQCEELIYKGRKVKRISAEPSQAIKENTKIKELTYYYDEKENRLFEITAVFIPAHTIQKQTITYNKIDFNLKGWKETSARSKIMTSDGKLLPKYKNYTLVKSN